MIKKELKPCPCCRETRSWFDYYIQEDTRKQGIVYRGVGTEYYRKGLFKRRKRRFFDSYYCLSCGTHYIKEIYE